MKKKKRKPSAKRTAPWRSPRQPLRPVPEDAVLVRKIGAQLLAYQYAAESTDTGRRAIALCSRGVELGRRNNLLAAHQLYLEAAKLFAPDDTSAAAAWCWHCLAESFLDLPSGVRVENLSQAQALYRRALASTERKQEPSRYSMSQNGLARCLRHLAQEAPSGITDELLDEAEELLVQACSTTVRAGYMGWSWAVQHLHNLGNLFIQRGKTDEAIEAFEECNRHWEAMERFSVTRHDILTEEIPQKKVNTLLAIADARMRRLRPDDRKRMKTCLRQVIDSGQPPYVDMARCQLVAYLLGRGDAHQARALAELDKIVIERLPNHAIFALADMLEQANQRKRACDVLGKGIHDALDQRCHALADYAADNHASDALQFAIRAAYLYADIQEPIHAFLVLEQVSGNRYYDNIASHGWRPRDPITRHLYEQMQLSGSMAALLDDWAGWVAVLPDDDAIRDELASLSDSMRAAGEDRPEALLFHSREELEQSRQRIQILTDSMRRALDAPVPAAFLREQARHFVNEHHRYRALCQSRAADFESHGKPWHMRMIVGGLEAVAREHSDHVFIRVHLLDELLVAAIWWDGDKLAGNVMRIPIPGGYSGLCQALEADPRTSSAAQEFLEALDISAVFPPRRMKHCVFLPSLLAARVPLAALGPRGSTPLDHFDELSWLPTLVPLWMRQAPHPPRSGTLSIIPGDTKFHTIAMETAVTDETRLESAEATLERVLEQVRHADVVSFYTHGRHSSPESETGPSVQLHSKPDLNVIHIFPRHWAGMERVEIWACESGSDLPLDPRTPIVDEAFGFDALFHHQGVRSTIASLWKIPDFVTACIVNRYRQGLNSGLSAPHALASAQRWWLDEAVPRFRDYLLQMSEGEAVKAFTASLGIDEPVAELDAALGPVPPAMPSEQRVAELVSWLSSPRSWAGLRFLGVAERRPIEPWDPEYDRPLSDAEKAELDMLLAPEPTLDVDASDDIEALTPGEIPGPELALRMARRYRDRTVGASKHNLLRGLAWLHEAMTAADLESSQRLELATDAAWMWLDLARCETLGLPDLVLRPGSHALLDRVEQLLADMAAWTPAPTIEMQAVRIWLDLLRQDSALEALRRLPGVLATARERAARLAAEMRADSWHAVRALGELMDLAALAPDVPMEIAEPLLAALEQVEDWPSVPPGVVSRVMCATRALCCSANIRQRYDRPPEQALTHRNLVRDWFTIIHTSNRSASGETAAHEPDLPRKIRRTRDEELSWLDACYWDYPDNDQDTFWMSTGTPGFAHRGAIASYIQGQIKGPYGAELASQMLWALQRLCDLRLLRLNLWARLWGNQGTEQALTFWHLVRTREQLLEFLDDASQASTLPGHRPQRGLTRCDPFFTATDDILVAPFDKAEDALDLTAWYLANANRNWIENETRTATAAFDTARLLERLDAQIIAIWQSFTRAQLAFDVGKLRTDAPALLALHEPYIDQSIIEPMLRDLPENSMVIGVATTPSGNIVAAATMKLDGAFVQRAYCSDSPDSPRLTTALYALIGLQHDDLGLTRGMSTGRREPWQLIQNIMEPVLDALIPAKLPSPPDVLILAPGDLRALPWAGLNVRGQPLYGVAKSIRLLPALGFVQNVHMSAFARGRKHACWLAENPPEASEGETRFGAVAIRTLRAWFPRHTIIEPSQPVQEGNVIEASAIEAIAHELASLRIYGVAEMSPNVNTTTSGLSLSGRRVYSQHNTRMTFLPACDCVELWAAIGREGAAKLALRNDRDRIPGLVWSFLSCGAASVIDLAWPVHDLVKALVCEHFGILRHHEHQLAADALHNAVAWTASTLDVWRKAIGGYDSVADALASLDDLRRHEARRRGLRSDIIEPMSALADAPCVTLGSVDALIEEVCQAAHLAAFRFWGV